MTHPTISGPFTAKLLEGKKVSRTERQQAFFRADGRTVYNGDIVSGALRTLPFDGLSFDKDCSKVSGPVLFAGLMLEQFGHVLLNSLGRLWALESLPPDTQILFIPKRSINPQKYKHASNILKWLGFSGEFLLARDATEFDALYTCPDIFGERFSGGGWPGFYDWLDGRLGSAPNVDPDLKIYVSRSELGPKAGRFACEDHLEALLVRQGYKIVAPETLSLEEQTRVFRTAGKLIFAESSALHLYSLVCQPEQIGAVVKRRSVLPPLIANQVNDRNGGSFAIVDAIEEVYWPPLRGDHLSVSVLNFEVLGTKLQKHGLVDLSLGWESPSAAAQKLSLDAGLEGQQTMQTPAQRADFLRTLRKKRSA